MNPKAFMVGLFFLAALGLSAGCGTSCEDEAQAACKQFFNDDAGDGKKYDSCYRQALAECGHTG